MKILIIEDDVDLMESIAKCLTDEGHQIDSALNKFVAEDMIIEHEYDFVILDIGLPDGNGLDLIRVIKSNKKKMNIIILSAKNSLEDKIKGLDLGADDYITKPFSLGELFSRIKAINRRSFGQKSDVLVFNEIKIYLEAQEVFVNDKLLTLTQKEFQLLIYFISNQRRVLSKESISNHLWENQSDLMGSFDLIYTHVKNLRKKIEELGGNDYVKSVYGMGYKFVCE